MPKLHPSKNELADLLLGKLPDENCDRVASHLEGCPTCQETIGGFGSLGDSLLDGLQNVPPPAEDDSEYQRAYTKSVLLTPTLATSPTVTAPASSQPASASAAAAPSAARPAVVSLEQFTRSLSDCGLMSEDEVLAFIAGLLCDERPLDTETLARELVQREKLTAFQALNLSQGTGRNLVMGEYVVLDKIGAGGMGQVFKAQHRRMQRIVALKVLPPSSMKTPEAVQRFQRETQVAAQLIHPNIVTAFDAGQSDNLHFLVMEYVAGQDLSALSRSGPLDLDRALDYILQAARGLAFAHAKGIVHRDIKPSNMLLDERGVVRILDMGLARWEESEAAGHQITDTGAVMGSIDYMAPEQAYNTHYADARADVYSLGCTLYQLLTCQSVYPGKSVVEKILAHREKPIPSLHAARPEIPRELDAIAARMLAKKPADRYQSMNELIADLESFRSQTAGTAPKKSSSLTSQRRSPLQATGRRRPLALVLAGLCVAVVIGAVVGKDRIKAFLHTTPSAPISAGSAGGVPSLAVAPFDAGQAQAHQRAWAEYLSMRVESTNSIGMKMVLIPPGEFQMGNTPEQIAAASKMSDVPVEYVASSQPQHRVVLSKPFLCGATEVTVGQFRQFVDAAAKYASEWGNSGYDVVSLMGQDVDDQKGGQSWRKPGADVTDDSAVMQVTWNDAAAFCNWLSMKEKLAPCYRHSRGGWEFDPAANGYRLPSEAEWEYACRAGTTAQFSFGDDPKALEQYGWYDQNHEDNAALKIGLKPANAFNLHDMHGNVWEWCQDWYDEGFYQRANVSDPRGPASGDDRVCRGGSWSSGAGFCPSAFRFSNPPRHRYYDYGFRIVRTLDNPADKEHR